MAQLSARCSLCTHPIRSEENVTITLNVFLHRKWKALPAELESQTKAPGCCLSAVPLTKRAKQDGHCGRAAAHIIAIATCLRNAPDAGYRLCVGGCVCACACEWKAPNCPSLLTVWRESFRLCIFAMSRNANQYSQEIREVMYYHRPRLRQCVKESWIFLLYSLTL